MTLKQFGYLAGGAIAAFICYKLPLPFIFTWPLTVMAVLLGFGLAFVPIEERPMDVWILSFIRNIYSPTVFIWKRGKPTKESDATGPTPITLPLDHGTPAMKEMTNAPVPQKKATNSLFTWIDSLFIPPHHMTTPTSIPTKHESVNMPSTVVQHPTPSFQPQPPSKEIPNTTPVSPIENQPLPPVYPEIGKKVDEPTISVPSPKPQPVPAPTPTPTPTPTPSRIQDHYPPMNYPIAQKTDGPSRMPKEEQNTVHIYEPPIVDKIAPANDESIERIKELETKLAEAQKNALRMAELEKKLQEAEEKTATTLAQKHQLEESVNTMKTMDKKTQPAANTFKPAGVVSNDTGPTVRIYSPDAAIKAGLPKLTTFSNVVTGIVRDVDSGLLPGVLITICNTQGVPVRALKTNKLGQFAASTQLPNGVYIIEVEDPRGRFLFDRVQFTLNGAILPAVEIVAKSKREMDRADLEKKIFGQPNV
jgi:hypothetical protein